MANEKMHYIINHQGHANRNNRGITSYLLEWLTDKIASTGEDMEKREHLYTVGEM